MRNLLRISLAVAGLTAAATSAGAGTFVPVAPVTGGTSTTAFGINDSNIVTGNYLDSSGSQHGFVGPIDGSNYTSFDDAGGITQPRAINDAGSITGFDTGTTATWERSPKGKLAPVTKGGTALNGVAQGLNKAGLFGADYINATAATVGYLGQNNKYKTKLKLSIKNAGAAARGVDTAGDIVGWYYDTSTNLQHGFIIVGGKATAIDYPGATYTVMEGLNDKGIASGQYEDSAGAIHGFYYTVATKKSKAVDVSGATLTQVWGINDNDVLAVSSDVGSFAYCIHSKGCPAAPKFHQAQQGSSRPAQQ